MKNSVLPGLALIVTLLAGVAIGRLTVPAPALAQGAGAAMNCPDMQNMMQHAKSPSDQAMMQSMMTMHQSMQSASAQLTGDTDHDFLVMMVPHRQSSIAMAQVAAQNGQDPKVTALAKSIVAQEEQQITEIQQMLRNP